MEHMDDNIKLSIDELVKQRPVLTEEEMNEFCTYEEIVADAKRLFDEKVADIIAKMNLRVYT